MQPHSLKPDLAYMKRLVGAGLDGISVARREMPGGAFSPALHTVVWTPAAVGAAIGMCGTRLIGQKRSASRVAMGGLLGTAVGLSAALAWASRGYTSRAARQAIRLVNAARDARWLETHPIDYA